MRGPARREGKRGRKKYKKRKKDPRKEKWMGKRGVTVRLQDAIRIDERVERKEREREKSGGRGDS